ncbi:MAG: hypothetical protein DRP11_03225 [Candidatus Aenigmatarchaeota archaeon]|nr:MAG: hypothetical protein DRP11_03225 [Candidatus Aenigmarchaeota archaeon]
MEITEFNPWWETGAIDKEISSLKRRELFKELKKNLQKRQMDVIIGLRRVGKTVMMHHLIEHLLTSGVKPEEILYFSFDVEKREIDRIIKEYEEKVLKERIRNKRVYLFFDEVQKLEDWENKVKVLYDLNPKAKIILSGSSSLNLMKQGRESLAGRARFHHLNPLSFREFLILKDEKVPEEERFYIHRKRLELLINQFIPRGFPETIEMKEKEIDEYVKELVVERIIYRDIPESFRVEDVEIVKVLADYIFENPGVILNIDALSKDLGRHKKTVRNALNYLEISFLIKRVSNLRGSFLAASRKNRKAYPLHSSLVMSKDEDRILEALVRSEIEARYYWRKDKKEVDFILKDNEKIVPVEVKNKERIDRRDIGPLLKFSSLFGIDRGYIVYRGDEEEILHMDNNRVKVVPLTRFLLFEKNKLK